MLEKTMLFKLLLSITLIGIFNTATAKDLYVSVTGSDKLDGSSPRVDIWNGTGPFKTLHRAQQAIRQLKAAGKFNEGLTVHIGKGTYQLVSTLEFDEQDSGTASQPIIWEGEKNATVISGGISLTNCQPYDLNKPKQILSCTVNSELFDNATPEPVDRMLSNSHRMELFIGNERLHLARWPDDGWAHVKSPVTEKTSFLAYEQIPQFVGNSNTIRAHLYAGNDYYDQYIDVRNINVVTGQINLTQETKQKIAAGRRFYLENFYAGLNLPGEWFYQPLNSIIYFIPPEGTTVVKPKLSGLSHLIKAVSTEHVSFKNFKFIEAYDTAIVLNHTEDIVLDNNEISNVGGKAILGMNSGDTAITNNNLHDLGLGGITLYGGDRATLELSGNIVENNYIHDYDQLLFNYSPAIEVGGVGSHVLHNRIEFSNGNGIAIVGNEHVIEKNDISQICRQSGDCGAIYSGRDWTYRGNVIRHNYVHDFSGFMLNGQTLDIANNKIEYMKDGARGIYLDDGVSGFSVLGNIVSNVGFIGIQLGGGRDTLIENNVVFTDKFGIVIDSRSAQFDWSKNRDTLSTMPLNSSVWQEKYPELSIPMHNDKWPEGNTVRKNIIVTTKAGGKSIQYWMPKRGNTIADNIVWQPKAVFRVDYNILDAGVVKNGGLWDEWMTQGFEVNSLLADPCISINNASVTFTCANSPASTIGFEPIPTDIGIRY